MDITEDPLSILREGSRRDDSGDIGSEHPDAVMPAASDFWVSPNARDMDEQYFEPAVECPELVSALDAQRQLAFRDRQTHHSSPRSFIRFSR